MIKIWSFVLVWGQRSEGFIVVFAFTNFEFDSNLKFILNLISNWIGDLLFWMKNKKGIFIGFLWCVVFASVIWAKLTCRLGGNVKNLWVNLQIWFSLLSLNKSLIQKRKLKKRIKIKKWSRHACVQNQTNKKNRLKFR